MFYQEIKNSLNTLDSKFITFNDLESFYIDLLNKSSLTVKQIGLSNLDNWKFNNDGSFGHSSGKFFSINSVDYKNEISMILLQPEIGLLCNFMTIVDKTAYFLIQFKEEPGNINKIQMSPTIQATKSNYSKVHGGNLPNYWEEYIENKQNSSMLSFDLPEQGTRYWQKFNNNKIVLTPMFDEKNNYKWLTLGQILRFKNISNSVNSCLRSSLSLVYDFYLNDDDKKNTNSVKPHLNKLKKNNNKSFLSKDVKKFYQEDSDSLKFDNQNDRFEIVGVEVFSKSREILKWTQPLVAELSGQQYFLLSFQKNKEKYFIWSIDKEAGFKSGFNLGPSLKNISYENSFQDKILLFEEMNIKEKFIMSEEGGRFLNFEVEHILSEINEEQFDTKNHDYLVLNEYETNELNKLGYLSMEARSLFFFSLD